VDQAGFVGFGAQQQCAQQIVDALQGVRIDDSRQRVERRGGGGAGARRGGGEGGGGGGHGAGGGGEGPGARFFHTRLLLDQQAHLHQVGGDFEHMIRVHADTAADLLDGGAPVGGAQYLPVV